MSPYTRIRLVTGEQACIVEVLEDGKAYLADIDHEDGSTSTEFIAHEQIDHIVDYIPLWKQEESE